MKPLRIIAVAMLMLITACGKHNDEQLDVKFTPPVVKADSEPPVNVESGDIQITAAEGNADVTPVVLPNAPRVTQITTKIIKEGDISFETENVADTRKQIIRSLKQAGGYIEDDSESINGSDNRKEYVMSVRIPAVHFDVFVGSVSGTATKIDSKNIRIKDVTTQFIDTKTRLDNKKQLELRYLDLLKKASKMTDFLAIEEKLTQIRSDIESTQSQLNYMSKQIAYSSLAITFYTKQAQQVAAGNGFFYKLKSAVANGFDALQSLFFGGIAFWPYILLTLLITMFIRRWKRKRTLVKPA